MVTKMVIGPEALEQRFTQRDVHLVRQLEDHIDHALAARFDGRNTVTITKRHFKDLRKPAQERLFDKYRRAGWDVQEHFDQRDGDYVAFTPGYVGPYGRGGQGRW